MADDLNSGLRRAAIGLCPSWRMAWACALLSVISLCPASAQDDAKKSDVESPLPPGYKAPLDPPEMMLLEKPLLSDEERKTQRSKMNSQFMKRVRAGDLRTEDAKTEVANGIRWLLNELALPSQRKSMTTNRFKLMGYLRQGGQFLDKADQKVEFRKQLLQLVTDETAKLFDNNYYVRIQAALILGELNLVEEDQGKGVKAEPFPPASKPLCQVLLDPAQPDSLKIVCTLALIRILAGGDPNVQVGKPNIEQKRDIAQAMISELMRKEPPPHPWYQMRLVEGLGYNDAIIDLDRKPFIYDCLIAVLNDPNRDLRTRIQAAWSLARHPEKGPNIPQMIAQTAALGIELADAQAKEPKDPIWRSCAYTLYLAFKNQDVNDLDAKRDFNRKGGFLAEGSPTANAAKPAYENLVPILRQIIAEKMPAPEQIQALQKWLDAQPDGKPKGNVVGKGNGN